MSVSGLNKHHRAIARDRAVNAALLGYHHRSEIHYTQGSERWEGIAAHRVARKGQFPRHADCSAYATWCLWNGLYIPFDLHDNVNGAQWKSGWTGTQASHGKRIQHLDDVRRADLVLYGSGPSFQHVAIVVGFEHGKPIVVSHGSENGPYLLPYNYRGDVGQVRRYI